MNLDLYITIYERLIGKNTKVIIYHDSQKVIEFGVNDKQNFFNSGALSLATENNYSRSNMNNMNNMNYPNMNNIYYQNMGGNMNNMNYANMGGNMNNMNYPNMGGNMNNMNYQNMGGNIKNDDNSILKKENENYKDRINQLETEGKNKDERILELEKKLKDFKSYFLSEGEELISLSCISSDQTIKDFKVIGKSSDKFTIIENKIYDKYPDYQETNNYFLVNGIKVSKYKTLKENKIKNNDTLFLFVDNDDD